MIRKLWITGLAVGLATASAGAWADQERSDSRNSASDFDYAQVVDVQPLTRRVRVSEPVRECWDEVSYASDGPFSSRHVGSTLLGGLIGGVLGNQVGSGSGQTAARIGGAIIGGAIGHNASRNRQAGTYANERTVERCEVRYRDSWEERIDGYDVAYMYGGRRYMTRMPYDPGDRVRVRVDVTPMGG